ncbi:MAG TPA: rhomboid family intramembrane serine protease [Rhizomicrobium sp.]|jgi:membrane associated rhomboid family serine protease|nr:rhomboid family intramembrane serine protease [Rhizomicrobium sp.]
MIPISDDNPVRITPFVSWLLVLGCCAAFAWELSLGDQMDAVLDRIAFVPAHGVTATGVPVLTKAALISIVVSMFLHGGWLHLGGNMLYLWIFGNNIEDAMGHVKYALFYFICGFAAAYAMAYMDPTSQIPMVGASGAISGALAAYVLLYPRARINVIVPLGIIFYPFKISAVWVVGFWFILQLLSAAMSDASQPGVAWWAHVGGFVAGLVLTPLLKSRYVPLFGRVRRGPWT